MAATSVHPRAVFLMLKNAWRSYVGVASIAVVNISSSALASPVTMTGTAVPASVGPITVEIITSPGAVQKAVQTVPVTSAGTWSASFSGITPIGAYQARITTIPSASHTPVLSNVFNKT